MGLHRIIVESDSKENISALAHDMLKDIFQSCRWSWVPRSVNLAANRLASRSNTEMCGSTWISRPPSSLVHILNKDGSGADCVSGSDMDKDCLPSISSALPVPFCLCNHG
ncbi:hypothetical protein DVH24_028474 [Malus domestica]|uniref:RNase H type-1 domain-containing protein n=1 Tax=Malus domestica TaxID=3750 RepID=A0A498KW58_MALDO|nr:hypothetical protein DVH24_028474 [Malus domestica]